MIIHIVNPHQDRDWNDYEVFCQPGDNHGGMWPSPEEEDWDMAMVVSRLSYGDVCRKTLCPRCLEEAKCLELYTL